MIDFDKLASLETINEAIKALKARGITAELVETKEKAMERLKELIPAQSEIMTGGSTTLEQIGFIDLLKSGKHPWKNLKDELLAEKNEAKQTELRKKSISSQFFIGSIQAVVKTGEVLIASASGSQIPAYAFASDNAMWVVGSQKIVSSLEEGFKMSKIFNHFLISG